MNTTTESDGRTTRWQEHNSQRRRDLVASTLRAIRLHGAGVGMEEVAAQAGTSKTVIYRHFGGRTGLYVAVVEWVHEFIRRKLSPVLHTAGDSDPGAIVRELADTYLSLVERDPEIYQFVVTRPPTTDPLADPVTSITSRVGDEVSEAFGAWLEANGHDARAATTWGHGVVGFVWAVADKWITTGHQRPRADIVEFAARLFEPAFSHQQPLATHPSQGR